MPLEDYRKKRDFTKTPEPAGTVGRKKARERFFCVQKHLASHLHYDLRIEHDGVLLSWAVPKGPSLNPKVKRLAMKVEDHPIEYGMFEGVIPDGYGAGIVMLWDWGTWTPDVDDVDEALGRGELKFRLNGFKLKGSWVLVRTSGRYAGARGGSADGRTWLLIKHRDEWAGEVDIAEFAPKSVKSGGDFEDILAEDTPAVWLSNRPTRGGEAGSMLAAIIERAAELKAERESRAGTTARPSVEEPQRAHRAQRKRATQTTRKTPRSRRKKPA